MCSGQSLFMGWFESVTECAIRCFERSSMFIFGSVDFGRTDRCLGDPQRCKCQCEMTATNEGECDVTANTGYRLYKYT